MSFLNRENQFCLSRTLEKSRYFPAYGHLILTFRNGCGQCSVSCLSHSVNETPLTCYEDRVDGYNRVSYNHFNSNPKRFLRQNEMSWQPSSKASRNIIKWALYNEPNYHIFLESKAIFSLLL